MSHVELILVITLKLSTIPQGIIEVDEAHQMDLVGKQVMVFIDDSSSLTLEKIKEGIYFQPSEASYFNFPPGHHTVWLKLFIRNKTNQDAILRVGNGLISSVTIDVNGTTINSGYSDKDGSRNLLNQYQFVIAKASDKELKTIYVALYNAGYNIEAPVYVGTRRGMQVLQQKEDWVVAMYIGAVLVMLCYNLVIYLMSGERSYLFYLFYLVSLGITASIVNGGYAQFWLFRNHGGLNFYYYAFNCINSFFFLVFVHQFLRIDIRKSFWLRLAYTLFLIMLFLGLINLTAGITGNKHWWNGQAVNSMLVMVSLFYLTFLILVVKRWLGGMRYAKFLLIGWGAFFLSMWLAIIAQSFESIPYGFWTVKAGLLGSFIEILLFSSALSNRMNLLKEEKRIASMKILEKAVEKEQIIQKQKIILEQMVEERVFELNMLNHNLENKHHQLKEEILSKNRLMDMVAKDLLSPIKMIGNIARDEEKKASNEHWSRIITQATNGERLITDLTTITETSLEKEDSIERIDVVPFFQEMLTSLKVDANRKGIQFDISFSEKVEPIHSDPVAIRRIVENLVSNAIKFSPLMGSVSINIREMDLFLRIEIIDSGPGFTKDDKSKMFRNFQRLSAQPTNNESSTGLGLSIVKTLCEQLNARLSFDSELGKGTKFTIDFPKEAQ